MKVVVADTSPVNYLVLIDCIDVLRRLYARVVIPDEVLSELTSAAQAVKRGLPLTMTYPPSSGGVAILLD